MKSLADFLSELKRRRVFRVAAVYAGVAFIIIQIIDGAFDYLRIPEVVGTTIIVLLAIGFPIAIGLAWAFDITDKGIKRTQADKEARSAGSATRPWTSNIVLAVVFVAVVIVAVWGWWGQLREDQTDGDLPRIAVLLPYYVGDETKRESLTYGVHGELINSLSTMSGLLPIGQTTMRYISEKDSPLLEKANEVNADFLVEMNITLEEYLVRVRATLTDAATERPVYNKSYNTEWSSILSLYDEVIKDLVAGIGATLTPEEEQRLTGAPQVNPEAHNWYLLGWQQRLIETSESIPRAVEYLERSVALDSTFAPAWSALAISYWLARGQNVGWNSDSTLSLMYYALDRAQELDSDDVLALVWRGVLEYYGPRDRTNYAAAEAYFKRALDLETSNVYARDEYAQFLRRRARYEESLAEFQRALAIDPLHPHTLQEIAILYRRIRQYDKALEYDRLYDEVRGLTPSDQTYLEYLIFMQEGRYAEAAALAEERGALLDQMQAEWALGNRDKVYVIRDSMVSIGLWPQQEQEAPGTYSRFYSIVGEKEKALDLLEPYVEENPDYLYTSFIYYPIYDPLRAEPRFKALLEKLGFTEYFDENGNLLQPIDETLEAYNAPGSR